MKKMYSKLWKIVLVPIMVFTTLMCNAPMDVFALVTTQEMAHIKAGSDNGNEHFGGGKPEAFVLSDKADFKNENFSFQIKMESEKAETRFRFVTKYVDDSHWGYIAYDGLSNNWFYEYKNGDKSGYPGLGALPEIRKNDIVNISGEYKENGLNISVENKTTKETKTAVASNADYLSLANQPGKIGFGAATYQTQYTDFYFNKVIVGSTIYKEDDYSKWEIYKGTDKNHLWEPKVVVSMEDGTEVPPITGRAWYKLTGGSKNGGGHAYGNAAANAPVLLLDNDKKMAEGGSLSMSLKPSANWGVFYTYVDDNNWLYVGWDSSSRWYYQYKVDGAESYPGIPGLPDPVANQEMNLSVSLNRETLSVNVNGTIVNVTNQALINFSNKTAGKGRFGVKTNGATSISFADVMYNNTNCMEDNWVFAATRDGQLKEKTFSQMLPVSGVVKDSVTSEPVSGAVVRIGSQATNTADDGSYNFEGVEAGTYAMAVTKAGYQAEERTVTINKDGGNFFDIDLKLKQDIDLTNYDSIKTEDMTAYIGKDFPLVARYVMKDGSIFRGNESKLEEIAINGKDIKPEVTIKETDDSSRVYRMVVKDEPSKIDFTMDVKVSVKENTLTWEVIKITKEKDCVKIATINVPGLNLLSVDSVEANANFAGASTSTTTTVSGDNFINFGSGFVPSNSDGYLYGFLTNEKLSAGLFSNSEIEGDKRVIRNNGADTISLTSAPWYYEAGDKNGQKRKDLPDYPTSDLPCVKVAVAGDTNEDKTIDWNDGAIAFRKIMNVPQGSEKIKDLVNYRIIMNFASMASNPYLVTADNIKKVALATDGLPQAVMLKGYGNEGHDSANSEYADIAEREGGVKDFQSLIKIAHDYNTEVGIHVNAQEAYPEAASFNEAMLQKPFGNGWGWLDQSVVIDKQWDLATQARWKRFVQLYDRINDTDFYDRKWPEAVKDSLGNVKADKSEITADAKKRPNNMDFIYLDVWYQDAWETRQIAKEINSLGWRFSTEFSSTGEYDSTWQHWSTDASYGGPTSKGYNSDIIRFIRNDQRDSQVLNHPEFGGTADNPLLGGSRLYGFEGWGGDKDFNNYITQTFNQNLPTKFLQHYYVIDWENYEGKTSPVGNHEKEITLKNDSGDKVVVTRNEEQRSDTNIERTITLNGKKVLDDVTYLLPWNDEDGTQKLYHWNLDGGTTSWDLPGEWATLGNIDVYELSDQGRTNKISVPVENGKVTLTAKKATAYVVAKGKESNILKNGFGESDYVKDPGFNSYGAGEKLSKDVWSGDIKDDSVVVEKADTGDQRLTFNNPTKDVQVSTEIKGLKEGTNYVAEVYVENNSDVKATIDVNTGKDSVSNYTIRSILGNYVKSDQKNGTKMQRMQISFTAEKDSAILTLSRKAGKGSTYMDDIRIVEKTVDNFQEDGSFKQDFESVVQGLYPFVLSSAQGISDPATHLSQLNDPYTQAGWNGRVISDVIDGNWSLKHHDGNTGIIYQTLPQNFHFEADKVYTVEFDYQSGPEAYAMVVGDATTYNKPTKYLEATPYQTSDKDKVLTKHVTMNLIGSKSGQTWIGLYQNGSLAGSGSMGQRDFVLDNLVIKESNDTNFVDVSKTTLYKGEIAEINGNNLDKIEWTTTNDKVATVNRETNEIFALNAGSVTLTATYPDKTKFEFKLKVDDSVVTDVEAEEYGKLSVEANTEQTSGEPAGSGIKEAIIDGKSSTYWHSQWSGAGFVVSEKNPAIIKIHMETPIAINGFKLQQRPSGGNNGVVKQFSYRILDVDGNVINQKEHVKVPTDLQTSSAVIVESFKAENPSSLAKTIEISVEEGVGNFASISEVSPIRMINVADTATLEDTTMLVGTKKEMEVKHPENTMLKGIVWKSSNAKVATVSQTGVITALRKGKTTITITNAAGLKAEAVVTVIKLNTDDLKNQITKAEGLDLSEYVDSIEKTNFINALEHAKSMLNDALTQKEIDDAVKALEEAQNTLMSTIVEDTEAPTAPNNLKATVEQTSVVLTWKASSDNVGVKGYKIYLDGNLLGSVSDCATMIDNLQPKTTYFVEVRAFDEANNLSDAASHKFTTKNVTGGGEDNTGKPEEPSNPNTPNDGNANNGNANNGNANNGTIKAPVITPVPSPTTQEKEKTKEDAVEKKETKDVEEKETPKAKDKVSKNETPKAKNDDNNQNMLMVGLVALLAIIAGIVFAIFRKKKVQ